MKIIVSLLMLLAFQFVHPNETMIYTEKGNAIKDGYLYSYGFTRSSIYDEVDGYLKKESSLGELIYEVHFDFGYDEIFVSFAFFEEEYIGIVVEESIRYNNDLPSRFCYTEVLIFNEDGFLLNRKRYEEKFNTYANINHQLLLKNDSKQIVLDSLLNESSDFLFKKESEVSIQYLGEAYIDGVYVKKIQLENPGLYHIRIRHQTYDYEFSVIVYPIFEIDQTNLLNPDYLRMMNGNVTINGIAWDESIQINNPGIYDVDIQGMNEYIFHYQSVVDFEFFGVEDNGVYYDQLSIHSNATRMVLDGKDYFGEILTESKHYNLLLIGENGFEKEIQFDIYPTLKGIEDGKTYDIKADYFAFGNCLLDGNWIQGYGTISEPGLHEVSLIYNGESYKKIFFTVLEQSDQVKKADLSRLYYLMIAILFFSGIILIKKKIR